MSEHCGVERPLARERVDVEEIAHPAVLRAELDHRMQLLGDRGLRRVRSQAWAREREHARVLDLLRLRKDSVTDTDVDLHFEPSFPQARDRLYPLFPIGVLDADWPDAQGRSVELEAVRFDR